MVGFWATLSLNIPDFSRFADSQKSQVVGQIVGLASAAVKVRYERHYRQAETEMRAAVALLVRTLGGRGP